MSNVVGVVSGGITGVMSGEFGNDTTPRQRLSAILRADGKTVANYQKGIGITGTTNASAWANQIGAAGSLLQASGAAQPTINADGSLTFDGIAQFMQAAFTLVQPETFYLVAKQITWNGSRIFDGNTASSASLYQSATTPQVRLYAGADGTVNGNWAVNTYGVVTAIFNSGTGSLSINGGTPTAGSIGAADAGGFTIGASPGPVGPSNIQVKEIIIRNVADSAAVRAQIQACLKAIYGTP